MTQIQNKTQSRPARGQISPVLSVPSASVEDPRKSALNSLILRCQDFNSVDQEQLTQLVETAAPGLPKEMFGSLRLVICPLI